MVGSPPTGRRGGRRIGMRLWLGAAFAGVPIITAFDGYLFVDDSSGEKLQELSSDGAVGRANSVADQIQRGEQTPSESRDAANTETVQVGAVNRRGGPGASEAAPPGDLRTMPRAGDAAVAAREGRNYRGA